MIADVEWSNVHLAGAFILGAVFGTIATLRVVRAVVTLLGGHPSPPTRPPEAPTRPPEARTGRGTVVDT